MSQILSRFTSTIFLISFYLISFAPQAEVVIKDEKGNIIRLSIPAKRIISLAPHITETLYKAGAGDKIVGVIGYSDFPEAAKRITRIGNYPNFDIEKIISLKPDLIIAWASGGSKEQVKIFSRVGIPVFLSDPTEIKDVAKSIRTYGVLAGTEKIANRESDKFLSHYHKLKRKRYNTTLKVFYQIWNKPLMTVNGNHLISKVIELCGGENVFSGLPSLTPSISTESVIHSQADVIIAGGMGDERADWFDEWKKWPQLAAVKNQNIYFVNADFLQRAGPRILQGADQLCDILDKVRKQH